VPAGAQLLRTGGLWDASTESVSSGRTVFGGYFILPRGQTKTIRFDYRLPLILGNGSYYTLHLEKQPGAPVIPLHVSVVLPNEFSASSDAPFVLVDDVL
jgi:hypothetical protein